MLLLVGKSRRLTHKVIVVALTALIDMSDDEGGKDEGGYEEKVSWTEPFF